MWARNQPAPLNLSPRAFEELRALATGHGFDISELSYEDTQTLLIVVGLQRWIESFGLQSPFQITDVRRMSNAENKKT